MNWGDVQERHFDKLLLSALRPKTEQGKYFYIFYCYYIQKYTIKSIADNVLIYKIKWVTHLIFLLYRYFQ